jgi:secondary thiamine-phosphate synthase enzyme
MPAPAKRPLRVITGPAAAGGQPHIRRTGSLTLWAETLAIHTQRAQQFIDLTDQVATMVHRSEVRQGWVSVFSKHTTAAILLNEHDPRLLEDMAGLLRRLAAGQTYQHEDNGHSHCQHLLLSSSETIPIVDGAMELGRWQRIFFLELDQARDREVVVQVFGA